jgi:methylated-DNA-[protein]-cysteine S-methyltransferase
MTASARREPTPFERRVYDAVSRVPRGRVTTYGDLARHLGCGSAQAVGQALRRNPFAPRVPCHRVVASDRSLGGFNGARAGHELRRKVALLADEGVCFSTETTVARDSLWCFDPS